MGLLGPPQITKFHSRAGLNTGRLFALSPGGWTAGTKVSAGWSLPRPLSWACGCHLLPVPAGGVILCVSCCLCPHLLFEDTSPGGLGPHPSDPILPNHLLTGPITCKHSTSRGTAAYEFWGDKFSP